MMFFQIRLNAKQESTIELYTVKQDSMLTARGADSMSLVQLVEEAVPQLQAFEDGELRNCQIVNYSDGETVKRQCFRMCKVFMNFAGNYP